MNAVPMILPKNCLNGDIVGVTSGIRIQQIGARIYVCTNNRWEFSITVPLYYEDIGLNYGSVIDSSSVLMAVGIVIYRLWRGKHGNRKS